jgi:polyisoprenoid-binding protein YceI
MRETLMVALCQQSKVNAMKKLIVWGMLLFAATFTLHAQSVRQVKSFKMSVAGTSTLHEWESTVNKVIAKSEIASENGVLQSIKSLYVEVDAKSITSTKGKIMDNKTWEALKADKHPKITYKLTKVESITKSGADYTVKTTGNLTIAGVTKSVALDAKGKVMANGDVEFSGSKLVVLSDFGMEQPTALMGTVKVGNEVTVKYSVVMTGTVVQ